MWADSRDSILRNEGDGREGSEEEGDVRNSLSPSKTLSVAKAKGGGLRSLCLFAEVVIGTGTMYDVEGEGVVQ
jgi:hypothetical protein